jgi:hypothetical protein
LEAVLLKITTPEHLQRLQEMGAIYREFFREHQGIGDYALGVAFETPVMLKPEQVENARVFSDRQHLVKALSGQGTVGGEIGTLRGDFASYILETVLPKKLYLFDLDMQTYDVAKRFENEIDAKLVELIEGDSSTRLAQFPADHFDWLYIDGDHSYAGCRKDLIQAVRTVKPGGLIFANDYIFFSHVEGVPFGVIHAVNELCHEYGAEIAGLSLQPQMYCDVAVRLPASS